MVVLALAFALGCSAAMAAAQAVELTVRTDRPEAVYAKGETATFIIEMKDGGQPVPQAALDVELFTSRQPQGEHRQLLLEGGRAEVQAGQPEACMLWARVTYQPEGGEAVKAVGGAAFSPEEIRPAMPTPEDFDEFWSAQKAALDALRAAAMGRMGPIAMLIRFST